MNFKSIGFYAVTAVLALLVCCLPDAHGGNSTYSTPFIALSSVSVPEIPAKAAELVGAAAASERPQTGRDVLRAVSTIARPGVLPYVVGALCRRNPETAGSVVASAIGVHPEDVLVFAKAALCAASSQVGQIVFSACRAAPAASADVALVALRELPTAGELIRTRLADARPDLELYLEEAEADLGTNDYQAVIKKSVQLFNDASKGRAK